MEPPVLDQNGQINTSADSVERVIDDLQWFDNVADVRRDGDEVTVEFDESLYLPEDLARTMLRFGYVVHWAVDRHVNFRRLSEMDVEK